MKKYLITILIPKTGYNIPISSDEYTINSDVEKHLGGWDNIENHAMTSNRNINDHFTDKDNYQMAGRTKDSDIYFSILCYKSEN